MLFKLLDKKIIVDSSMINFPLPFYPPIWFINPRVSIYSDSIIQDDKKKKKRKNRDKTIILVSIIPLD